ncbi:MAG TPA: ATPase [Deltaproteobacteria bacterium]|nr:ATPase [Deltaproteobacteria bacterium]
MSGRGAIEVADLEGIFRECFFEEHRTVLVGGGEEPVYLPSPDPGRLPHRIVYREDYLASALHEVAHWCLAGQRRRRLEDYGYWYVPDGRNADEQRAFERVEAAPQALEWIFSDACRVPFHLSVDNLEGDAGPSPDFQALVEEQRRRFLGKGLPPRAAAYRYALQEWAERNGERPDQESAGASGGEDSRAGESG